MLPTVYFQLVSIKIYLQCDLLEDSSHQSKRHSTISRQYGFQGNDSFFLNKRYPKGSIESVMEFYSVAAEIQKISTSNSSQRILVYRIYSNRSRPSIILDFNFPRLLLESFWSTQELEQKFLWSSINIGLNDPILKSFKKISHLNH